MTATPSFELIAKRLIEWTTQSEGHTRAFLIVIEILTPGLRQVHGQFKEIAQKCQRRQVMEVEVHLKDEPGLHPLLFRIYQDLESFHDQEWWTQIREVAEYGAHREVLYKMAYKSLGKDPQVQTIRHQWMNAFLKSDQTQRFYQKLTHQQTQAHSLPFTALAHTCLTSLKIPKLDGPKTEQWIQYQRQMNEMILSQSWGRFQDVLKEMVALEPRNEQVCLYWSLSKCALGETEQALTGLKRASEIDPQNLQIQALLEESKTWKQLIQQEQEEKQKVHEEDTNQKQHQTSYIYFKN